MGNELQNTILAAADKARYDTQAKKLLSYKIILAHILEKTVEEFRGMDPKIIVSYIQGDPIVSKVPVDPGLTNIVKVTEEGKRIFGLNTEDAEINEGFVRFDIIFYVRMKNGLSQMIINIEAQKDEPSEYHLLNRAQFYVCRLVSSQKGRDFEDTNYDDIKSVVSIWICMNMSENSLTHYHMTHDNHLGSQNWTGNENMLGVVIVGLADTVPETGEEYELHRLLNALLSLDLAYQEKIDIIEQQCNIQEDEKLRKDVSIMCNLSQGVFERGIKRGIETGIERGINKAQIDMIMRMEKKGYPIEEIAELSTKTVDEVRSIIDSQLATV